MGIFNLASPPEIGMQSVKVGIFNNTEKALVINFSEYCKNFRKISLTSLFPHHNYQYYHTGAWLDCRTNALQPQSVSTAVFINDKQISNSFIISLSQTAKFLIQTKELQLLQGTAMTAV